ncbi:MAG TPA: RNA polymerase sigma factor [Methylomirabilota bacterium]|nr:RNA polymerase sigma factor [Methylomirabilota bacterium]
MVPENEVQVLIGRAQQQDQAAFGDIYDLYAKPLYNFLFTKVRHQQTAEDLLHTVFLKAWQNLSSYKPRSTAKFSTWLYQIANYTLIDYWRTKKPIVELEVVENLSQFAQDPKLYEEYSYLWDSIKKLPFDYQTVLDLRFRQDLSVEETAIIMRKTQVGIRVLQHRALKALKHQLAPINQT